MYGAVSKKQNYAEQKRGLESYTISRYLHQMEILWSLYMLTTIYQPFSNILFVLKSTLYLCLPPPPHTHTGTHTVSPLHSRAEFWA